MTKIKTLWDGFFGDLTFGLNDLFIRLTKEMTHLLKPSKPQKVGEENENETGIKEENKDLEMSEEGMVDYEGIFFTDEFQDQFDEKDKEVKKRIHNTITFFTAAS